MKKHLLGLTLAVGLILPVFAQAQEPNPERKPDSESMEKVAQDNSETGVGEDLLYKWINFGIFAALLGFVAVKKGPAFFNARTADIQKAIKDATGLKLEADFRASEIDRKMATLGSEVQKLRDESKVEMEREHQRIVRETEAGIQRLQQHLALELSSMQLNARKELRRHTSELAVSMAASRLRDELTGDDHSRLIGYFGDAIERGQD